MSDYRLWVSDDRCTLVELWPATDEHDEIVKVATRTATNQTWGPPVYLTEEKT